MVFAVPGAVPILILRNFGVQGLLGPAITIGDRQDPWEIVARYREGIPYGGLWKVYL